MPTGFFAETGRYELEVDLGRDPLPDDVEVLIGDTPADLLVRRGRAFYPFDVGFNAGFLSICLVRSARVIASIDVLVDPDQAKLTREDYAELLADITQSTLSLYRLGGLSIPASSAASGVRAALVTLDLIRSGFDDLERAICRVADQPNRRLASTKRRVDVLRARGVDDRALAQAMRSRDGRLATTAEKEACPRLVAALHGQWVPSLSEAHRHDEADVYENRAILGFLIWLEGTLGSVHRRLETGAIGLAPGLTAVWAGRLQDWRRRVGALRRRDAFQGLKPDAALRSTSVFRLQPDYSRLFRLMARIKSGLGAGAEATPLVPLERTFELYEIWCYIRLLLAAAELHPSSRQQVANLLKGMDSPNLLGTTLLSGKASTLLLAENLSLTYQRRFGPTADPSGCRTYLIDAVPDIVIARDDAAGRSAGIVILDPKYRGGASLLDGLRDLHVYRDAIRNDDGVALTRAAAALAPRPFPYSESAIWDGTPTPGVVAARPGHDADVFKRMLRNATVALNEATVAAGEAMHK